MIQSEADLLAEAGALRRKGEVAAAAERYRQILRGDAQNTDALYHLAQLSCEQGDLAGGIEIVRAALAIDPQQGRLHNLIGMALNALDQPMQAVASFDRAIACRPDLASAHGSRGDALARLGRLAEAVASYDRALALVPASIENLINRGAALQELGRYEEALASYQRVIALRPDMADLHVNLGNTFAQIGRPHDALASFDKALAAEPQRVDALLGRARALIHLAIYDKGLQSFDAVLSLQPSNLDALDGRAFALNALDRPAEALAMCDRALAIAPTHLPALTNRGNALCALRRHEEALASYQAALKLAPDDYDALYNVGYAFSALNRFAEALASYDRVLAIKPDHVDAINGRGNALRGLRRYEEALKSNDLALKIDPGHADAMANRGTLLFALRRLDEAMSCYERALKIRPDHVSSHVGRGMVLFDRGLLDQALACFDCALDIDRDDLAALKNRALVLAAMGARDNATAIRKRVLAIDPHDGHAYSALLFSYLATCNWKDLAELTQDLKGRLASGQSVLEPFAVLECSGDPADHLRCARNYMQHRFPQPAQRLRPAGPQRHVPIRLAYLSVDFRRHPVAYAIAELFEGHDRSRFQVIGASCGRDDGSDIRTRIARGCDEFCDLSSKNDSEAASLLRELDVDIAIDLAGFTENSRPGILAQRPAPVQVNYVGYSATMGADFIDYMIADDVVLPFSEQAFFTEKIVRLPDCFLPNDGKQVMDRQPPSRIEAGLPETGFVFCSFNNSWKIRPPVFDVWMRLLSKIAGSVLWLARADDLATINLRREAQARGIDPARLLFAPKVPSREDHLARHQLADLFLDTLPYNAHSTAVDALSTGLPVLTVTGTSFAGRVAASALNAIGLSELATRSLAEYEDLALRLAGDPSALASVRMKLATNRATHALFNSDRFRRHIEAAYTSMWEIWQRGDGPRSFRVDPIDP